MSPVSNVRVQCSEFHISKFLEQDAALALVPGSTTACQDQCSTLYGSYLGKEDTVHPGTTQSPPLNFSISYFPIPSAALSQFCWPALTCLLPSEETWKVQSLNHSLETWVVLNARFHKNAQEIRKAMGSECSSQPTVFSSGQPPNLPKTPSTQGAVLPTQCFLKRIDIPAPLLERTALKR